MSDWSWDAWKERRSSPRRLSLKLRLGLHRDGSHARLERKGSGPIKASLTLVSLEGHIDCVVDFYPEPAHTETMVLAEVERVHLSLMRRG